MKEISNRNWYSPKYCHDIYIEAKFVNNVLGIKLLSPTLVS